MVWALALSRIILCLFPQNLWTSPDAPLSWGIYRNIPFVILGALIIALFIKSISQNHDRQLKFLPLAVALSFICYIPVVLFADKIPIAGALMIPKTCAYVWIVFILFFAMKDNKK